jgi:putative ABC transport system permease protein
MNAGAPVVVLDDELAARLFGRLDPLGKYVRIGGRPLMVVGLIHPPENIFAPPGQERGGIMPYRTAKTEFNYDNVMGLVIAVRAQASVSIDRAQDLVTVALRRGRGLRPGAPNTFDMLTQDQILNLVSQLTSAFFAVMIALSGVALMVGGIGVMAIMMVSVTDRTKEIGLRKAVGARRGEIMAQFLFEAATLTFMGGPARHHDGDAVGRDHQAGDFARGARPDLERGRRGAGLDRDRPGLRDVSGQPRGAYGSGGSIAARVGAGHP